MWVFAYLRLQDLQIMKSPFTETERPYVWKSWYSMKTGSNVSSQYQDCHTDDRSVSEYLELHLC